MEQDLSGAGQLLAEFLGQTSAGPDGVWAPEHLALLRDAQAALPPLLSAQEAAHASLSRCEGGPEGLMEARQRSEELTRQARRRLAEAPELLEYQAARQQLALWREHLPERQRAARKAACTGVASGPLVFHASQDERGRTEWLFCDGSKVSASPGVRPEHLPPPGHGKKAKKLPPAESYVDRALRYPMEKVDRAPRLPQKRTPPPSEEPKDELG